MAIQIYVDGATGGGQAAGAAAVARSDDGLYHGWISQHLPKMSNNEAEYWGLLLGFELARRIRLKHVALFSDSDTVVRQMQGRSRVHSKRLRLLHQRACSAARRFSSVAYTHVPREKNRLADALAGDALLGNIVTMPTPLLARFNPGASRHLRR